MSSDIQSKTVQGLMAFCDYLKDKGYQGPSVTDSWKSATKMVFETVEPESWETTSLDGVALDDVIRRFPTLAGAKVRAETVVVYRRRIRNAIDAQQYYTENGKPPSFNRAAGRAKSESSPGQAEGKHSTKKDAPALPPSEFAEMWEFEYPLTNGRMARLHVPKRMTKADVDRISTVLRTLQDDEQRQIPEKTGEKAIAA